MSTHGIKDVTFGLVDANGKLLTSDAGVGTNGIYLVDGDAKGATTATVSGLEARVLSPMLMMKQNEFQMVRHNHRSHWNSWILILTSCKNSKDIFRMRLMVVGHVNCQSPM